MPKLKSVLPLRNVLNLPIFKTKLLNLHNIQLNLIFDNKKMKLKYFITIFFNV